MKAKLLTLLIAVTCVSSAHASQGDKHDWEFSPYMGLGIPDNYGAADLDRGPLVGVRGGFFLSKPVNFEVSAHRLFTEAANGRNAYLDSFRFNALWNFRVEDMWRPFLTVGAGLERSALTSGTQNELGINAGTGFRWYFGGGGGLRLEGRYVTADVSGAPGGRQHNFEFTGGPFWTFGGGKKTVVQDTDGDGVPNGVDKCPATTGGVKVDSEGCEVKVDSDEDGVTDKEDQCPNTPKGIEVGRNGCVVTKDADGDNVSDETDKCPNTTAGIEVDPQGCPVDRDADGVPDHLDKCPGSEPGKSVDEMGCPMAMKSKGVLRGVTFEPNSNVLTGNARTVLEGVAEELKEFPEVHVEVQGHTDSQGSDARNSELSQNRAQAVVDYLIQQGIDTARLTAKGYGETQPIADNATAEGRATNRRVELKWLDQ